MTRNNGFRNLIVWQESKTLVKLVYQLTTKLPKEEMFGLTSQTRRAAVSIAANIAEGWNRSSTKDKKHFLEIAEGSLLELDTEMEICGEIGYITKDDFELFTQQKSKVGYLIYKYKTSW